MFIKEWGLNMANPPQDNLEIYLSPTSFIDSDSPGVIKFAEQCTYNAKSRIDKSIKIFYAVRDQIKYDPYHIELSPDKFNASRVLTQQTGWCVEKALLLAAAGRALGIPSRLGFADIRNHLVPESLKKTMKTDLFIFHGYTEMFLNDRWIKATPAFNLALCEKFDIVPVEFNGEKDAGFHKFDRKGNKHIEYITDHGSFADLPLERIVAVYRIYYPQFFDGTETAGELKS